MQSNPLDEIPMLVTDLEEVLNTLRLIKDVLMADDLARSGRLMVSASYTPLTKDVAARENRVEGILKDHYANQYLAGQDMDDEEEDQTVSEQAHLLELSANPLGSNVRPAAALVLTDDEGEAEDAP